nr:MAG TPA: intron associated endonuclease [Caudoviricetes sp.]
MIAIYSIKLDERTLYVGQASNFVNRKRHHLTMLRRGSHANVHLQRIWDKYGNFVFDIVELVPKREDLSKRERFWIKELNPECNMVTVSDSDSWIFPKERNAAISRALLGKSKTNEHRINISKSKLGSLNPMFGVKPPNQKIIEFNGISMNISEWARKIGISRKSLEGRIKRGWTIEKALTTPKVLR